MSLQLKASALISLFIFSSPSAFSQITNGLLGEYFSGSISSSPDYRRIDPRINFWWDGAPAPGVHEDNFKARWTGFLTAEHTERYTFRVQFDDTFELKLAGRSVLKFTRGWHTRSREVSVDMVAGEPVPIEMIFGENVGVAEIGLRWSSPSTPKQVIPRSAFTCELPSGLTAAPSESHPHVGQGNGLRARFFNGAKKYNGSPFAERIDPVIDFWWFPDGWTEIHGSVDSHHSEYPVPNIQEAFSIVWEGYLIAQYDETYTFYYQADDGGSVRINGNTLASKDGGAVEQVHGNIRLNAGGVYPIEVRFFNDKSQSDVMLSWSSPSTPKAIIPQSQLYSEMPTTDPNPPIITEGPIITPNPVTGTTATASLSASDADATDTLSYSWSIDRGATITPSGDGSNAAITFFRAGLHTVSVFVTSSGGGVAQGTTTVDVIGVPTALEINPQ